MNHPNAHTSTNEATTPPVAITKDEWLTRCAKRLTELGGLEPEVAHQVAEAQFENGNEDLTESPEDAADEEMSYWSED